MARYKFGLGNPTSNVLWIFLLVGGLFLSGGTGFGIYSTTHVLGGNSCEGVVIGIGPKNQFDSPSLSAEPGSAEPEKDSDYVGQDSPNQSNSSKKPGSFPRGGQNRHEWNGRGGSVPEVRYFVDGKPYVIHGVITTSPPAYSIGEKIPVYYPPGNPEQGVIGSFVELWLFPMIFGGIGLVFTLGSGFFILKNWMNPWPGS